MLISLSLHIIGVSSVDDDDDDDDDDEDSEFRKRD
jgi:hypothetical protein